jgi:lysophospholipid acyltransferase (LPLAT)-like uncharacterized protein
MLKRIGRSRAAQGALAFFAAHYLRLVERTTRFTLEPPDCRDRVTADAPVICALWHGQHLGAHFAWPPGIKVAALISRNRDAEANALALQRLGVIPIRGSGGRAEKMRKRGGFTALREMLRQLRAGVSLVLTADVPKTARVVGEGVVTLAKLSGRPIYPLAVANARRIDFNSWDRASLPLPFSRGAIVVGDPIRVPADASEADIEAARRRVESALDAAHARAYEILGSRDPGAGLREMRAARTGDAS